MKTVICDICGKEFSIKGIGSHKWRVHGEGVNFKPTLGHTSWNKDQTKETNESIRRGAEKLKRKKSELEDELDDDGKLKQRWVNKKVNALKEGIQCELTYDEYCSLVKQAGLVSSKLGFTGEKYVLARYNDIGNYTIDNCRFITQKENLEERNNHK